MNVGGYTFDGPFSSTAALRPECGVVVVMSMGIVFTQWIDVYAAANAREETERNPRQGCWLQHAWGQLQYAVLYLADQPQRREVEQGLRRRLQPSCGDQRSSRALSCPD